MKVKLFMENMWEFFLVFYFVPYKVNIPMYAGGFKQVLYKEYICWIQVKIHISDQTSLRICNSVLTSAAQVLIHCKKNLQNSCIFFYQTFQKRENPYADKGFFGALQRRNFLSFEEGKVFLSLQG